MAEPPVWALVTYVAVAAAAMMEALPAVLGIHLLFHSGQIYELGGTRHLLLLLLRPPAETERFGEGGEARETEEGEETRSGVTGNGSVLI